MAWYDSISEGWNDIVETAEQKWDEAVGEYTDAGKESIRSALDQKADDASAIPQRTDRQTMKVRAPAETAQPFNWQAAGVVVGVVGIALKLSGK